MRGDRVGVRAPTLRATPHGTLALPPNRPRGGHQGGILEKGHVHLPVPPGLRRSAKSVRGGVGEVYFDHGFLRRFAGIELGYVKIEKSKKV